jgi:hypothetical protein
LKPRWRRVFMAANVPATSLVGNPVPTSGDAAVTDGVASVRYFTLVIRPPVMYIVTAAVFTYKAARS